MNKGNKIKIFKGKRYPLFEYFRRGLMGIIVSSFLIWGNLFIYFTRKQIIPEYAVASIVVIIIVAWLIYSNYRQGSRIAVTAYENGIEVPKRGFFLWDELRVSQQKYLKQAPSVSFLPCYYIRLGYDKQTVIFQYLEDYTGLYHLLYTKGVPGADKELLIYNTTIDGVKIEIGPVYCAVFDPKTNILKNEKGNPFAEKGVGAH
jgi:hypothetical protein